jgi:hypothetical protein
MRLSKFAYDDGNPSHVSNCMIVKSASEPDPSLFILLQSDVVEMTTFANNSIVDRNDRHDQAELARLRVVKGKWASDFCAFF